MLQPMTALLLSLTLMAAVLVLLPDNSNNLSIHTTLFDSFQSNLPLPQQSEYESVPVPSLNDSLQQTHPHCNSAELSMVIMNFQSILPKKS